MTAVILPHFWVPPIYRKLYTFVSVLGVTLSLMGGGYKYGRNGPAEAEDGNRLTVRVSSRRETLYDARTGGERAKALVLSQTWFIMLIQHAYSIRPFAKCNSGCSFLIPQQQKQVYFLVLFKCSLQTVCYFGGDTTEDARCSLLHTVASCAALCGLHMLADVQHRSSEAKLILSTVILS